MFSCRYGCYTSTNNASYIRSYVLVLFVYCCVPQIVVHNDISSASGHAIPFNVIRRLFYAYFWKAFNFSGSRKICRIGWRLIGVGSTCASLYCNPLHWCLSCSVRTYLYAKILKIPKFLYLQTSKHDLQNSTSNKSTCIHWTFEICRLSGCVNIQKCTRTKAQTPGNLITNPPSNPSTVWEVLV